MGLMSWLRGKGETQYDYPSLPGVSYNGRPVNMAMSLGFGDEENEWIFDKVTGGKVPIQKDQDGRPFITVDGNSGLQSSGRPLAPGSYYLDRPGLDGQTWRVIGSNLALVAGTGGVGAGARAIAPRALTKLPGAVKAIGGSMGAFGTWETQRQAALSGAAKQNMMDPGEIAAQAAWGIPFAGVGPLAGAFKRSIGLRPLVREKVKWPKR